MATIWITGAQGFSGNIFPATYPGTTDDVMRSILEKISISWWLER